jgi:hypothetical protein
VKHLPLLILLSTLSVTAQPLGCEYDGMVKVGGAIGIQHVDVREESTMVLELKDRIWRYKCWPSRGLRTT